VCIRRVSQNRIYTPYMAVCMVISLPKIPYIHRIFMVLANPTTYIVYCIWYSIGIYVYDVWFGVSKCLQKVCIRCILYIVYYRYIHVYDVWFGVALTAYRIQNCVLCRVCQNHIYTVCIRYFGREITKYTVIYGAYTRF